MEELFARSQVARAKTQSQVVFLFSDLLVWYWWLPNPLSPAVFARPWGFCECDPYLLILAERRIEWRHVRQSDHEKALIILIPLLKVILSRRVQNSGKNFWFFYIFLPSILLGGRWLFWIQQAKPTLASCGFFSACCLWSLAVIPRMLQIGAIACGSRSTRRLSCSTCSPNPT